MAQTLSLGDVPICLNDSGSGDMVENRQMITRYADDDRNNKTTDRDIVRISPGIVPSGEETVPFDSTTAPFFRDSGKINQTLI